MNNIHIENQGSSTYLVYTIQSNDILDTMSLGMITNNSIKGLAPTIFTQMNTTKYIKYEITAKLAASKIFIGAVNKKRLVGVFSGIVEALLSAEDYMIDTNSIVLDLDYIFADVSTCETILICLPIVCENTESVDLRTFFKRIMFNIQSDQTENCDYVAKILNYLNGVSAFSLLEFKKVLDDIIRNNSSTNRYDSTTPVNPSVSHINNRQSGDVAASSTSVRKNVQQTTTVQSVNNQPIVPPQNNQQITTSSMPQVKKKKQNQKPIEVQQEVINTDEKPISMFYLLQHYNKENAAKYKAQKAAKKAKTKSNVQTNIPVSKSSTQSKQATPSGFAVPSQQNQSFAIPGQQNQSFAIPSQGSGSSQTVTPPQKYSAATTPVSQQPINQQVQPVSQGYNPNSSYSESPTDFGPTTVLGGNSDGATAVLSDIPAYGEEHVKQPVLIRVRNNERIPIDKPYFRIGKEKSYVDYFIGDNSYISRGHASIITRDGRYFIVDNNSRNHTYVNGQIITSSTEVELQSGYTIKLANEEFEFKLF